MKATSSLATNVSDVEVTMSITMSLREWMELKSQMGTEWTSKAFGRLIQDMVEKLDFKTFGHQENTPIPSREMFGVRND